MRVDCPKTPVFVPNSSLPYIFCVRLYIGHRLREGYGCNVHERAFFLIFPLPPTPSPPYLFSRLFLTPYPGVYSSPCIFIISHKPSFKLISPYLQTSIPCPSSFRPKLPPNPPSSSFQAQPSSPPYSSPIDFPSSD